MTEVQLPYSQVQSDFSHQSESELFESFSIVSHKNVLKCASFAFLQPEHQFGLKNKI